MIETPQVEGLGGGYNDALLALPFQSSSPSWRPERQGEEF
jgi:hypothetical protein